MQTTTVPDRDPGKTGASSGMNAAFINFDAKEGKWKVGTQLHDTIRFFLDQVDMEWRDAVPGTDIPVHWEIRLVGECDLGQGMKQYNFTLSSHWRTPLLGNIVNALLGALQTEAWKTNPRNRLVRLYTYLKQNSTNARSQSRAMLFGSDVKDDFLPDMYPWDESALRFKGVPEDLESAHNFWIERCRDLVMATGGTISGKHQWAEEFKSAKGIATSHVNGAPTPPPTTTTTEKPPAHQLALSYLQKIVGDGEPFHVAVKRTFDAFISRGNPEQSVKLLLSATTEWATKQDLLKQGEFITMTGEIQKSTPTNITANHDPIDDLPF